MKNHFNILIIKCEPRIDLLRSTALLATLSDVHENAKIHWITNRRNRFLLEQNDKIDHLLYIEDASTTAVWMNIEFALLINLDTGFTACNIANLAKADKKVGFAIDKAGRKYLLNPESRLLSDYEENSGEFIESYKFSYQKILLNICGFEGKDVAEMILSLPEKRNPRSEVFAAENNLSDWKYPVIAIYLGHNPKFAKYYLQPNPMSFMAEFLKDRLGAKVILTGGHQEKKLYDDTIVQCPPGVIEGGCDNSLSVLCSMLDHTDLVISTDSLILHTALALRKKAVALLNSDNDINIELYGRGVSLTSKAAEPESGYKLTGAIFLNEVTAEEVFSAAASLLNEYPTVSTS